MFFKAIVAACCCTPAIADWGIHSVPILAAIRIRGDRGQDEAFDTLRMFEHPHVVSRWNAEKLPRAGQTFLATGVRPQTDIAAGE